MTKQMWYTVFFSIYTLVILLVLIFLLSTGHTFLSVNGFALDSSGQVYVGGESKILVFKGADLVRTINPHTTRTYAFTIKDDKIVLSTSLVTYIMDLQGNTIIQEEDINNKTFNHLQRNRKVFVDNEGKKYVYKTGIFVRDHIVCTDNNIKIYEMPIKDYWIKILIVISAFNIVILVLSIISQIMKKRR